jgi:hypothetical protein
MESKHYLQRLTDNARQCIASAFAALTSSKALVLLIRQYTGENNEEKKKAILAQIKAMENDDSTGKEGEDVSFDNTGTFERA